MSERSTECKPMSRRQALSMLGLAAAVGYAIPTVLTVSDAEAGGVVVHRRRRSHPDWWYRRRHRTHWRPRWRSRRRRDYD